MFRELPFRGRHVKGAEVLNESSHGFCKVLETVDAGAGWTNMDPKLPGS